MEELCSQYQEYHSNSGTEITQESLVKQSRKLLTVIKPEERFVHLNIDFYRNVLGKISQNFESNEESIQRIKAGFNGLEKYGVNLWKFPWRKEYHTIKLYTAFFKCNIEQQLQEAEVIFEILKSLGYTVREQQKVSIKEPDRAGAIWASFSLFLVQVDLQVIKEIMEHFSNGEFTLKEIVMARSRKLNVEDAVYYLQRKGAKRRKMEEPQGDDAPSHGHTKDTHIGRIDSHAFNILQPDTRRSDAVTFTDPTSKRPAKRSVLSKGKEDVAADTDDSSTGSVLTTRHPSIGAPTEYKVSFGNTDGRHFTSLSTEQLGHFTDHDLYGLSPEGNQLSDAAQHNVDPRYSTAPTAGSDARYSTAPPAGSDARYSTAPPAGSDVRYSTAPPAGSDACYSTAPPADAKVNARYSTIPQARTSHYPDNTHRYHTSPQVGHPQYYDNIKDRMDAPTAASHSLSHHGTVPPMHFIHQYTNQSYGGFVGYDPRRYNVATQSGAVGAITNANGYQSTMSARTEAQVHGSSTGDARYVNLRDINSSAQQQFGSNNLDTAVSSKDNARRHDHRDARYGETHGSGAEPMEVEQMESSHERRSGTTSFYNGVAEGGYARATAKSGVTELNTTLEHKLTLEPSVRLSGKSSKEVSSASTVHGRQDDSESITNAQGATRSRAGITKQGQPSTSTNSIGRKTRSSAASNQDHTAEKGEAKGSSAAPSWRTPEQREQAQNAGHSSRNDVPDEASWKGKVRPKVVKSDDTNCELCDLEGTITCRKCHLITCRKCKVINELQHCSATKGDHAFVDLKDSKLQQRKSVDSKASLSQHYENINEGFDEERDWSCSRCTYLNPPDHTICAMCATTRGVGSVELTEAGSRVCRMCTYHNKENATVCRACHKTLDLQNPETSV